MSAVELIDIGLNLTHDSFDTDRDAVLMRAATAGIRHMLITGSDAAHSRKALALVKQHPEVLRSTAGVHPHHARDVTAEDQSTLLTLMKQPEVLAIGECGLDYFRNFSPHEDQERVFRWQLDCAVDIGKPVFLHERDAHEQFVSILREYRPKLSGAVAHCFTGNTGQVKTYIEMDLYVGITGWICDERRGQALREAVKHIPLERLLIETDAPYLIPRTIKPRPASHRNEPMYLTEVLRRLAVCRGESEAAVAKATTENAQRLFAWR
ncbi:MAG TPA: TatD family hydrolase [Steroidobacteraceae bacterium]|nr:TatD family hydrolase [Steroidobacteraceae bacterium]